MALKCSILREQGLVLKGARRIGQKVKGHGRSRWGVAKVSRQKPGVFPSISVPPYSVLSACGRSMTVGSPITKSAASLNNNCIASF
jgi:hypothetical protein